MVVVVFSEIDFSNSDLALVLSADEFPFFVEFDAGWTVGLIKVDEEGLSWFQKCWIPVRSIQEDSVAFFADSQFIFPFLVGSLSLFFLEFLMSLKIFSFFGSDVDQLIEFS